MKQDEWNQSYSRNENFIFYPHDDLVKFVNRHIRKRTGINSFSTHIGKEDISGLDFGCGIGATVKLMTDFQIEAYGVDISEIAVDVAKQHCPEAASRLNCINPNQALAFDDGQFDFVTSCCVLDSMPYEDALFNLKELYRVSKGPAYISLISGDNIQFYGEQLIEDAHEKGTIQTFYNLEMCEKLASSAGFKIIELYQVNHVIPGEHSQLTDSRYHMVLSK